MNLNAPFATTSNQPGTPNPAPVNPNGFPNFVANMQFRQRIADHNFPHRGAGAHVPVWLTPALAKEVLMRHGHTGHAIPHPDLDA
jgi:hypothetical protein